MYMYNITLHDRYKIWCRARYSGKVTHFVSWCWGYTLQDFASAVHSWLQRSKLNAEDVFLWVCFFCNNQRLVWRTIF